MWTPNYNNAEFHFMYDSHSPMIVALALPFYANKAGEFSIDANMIDTLKSKFGLWIKASTLTRYLRILERRHFIVKLSKDCYKLNSKAYKIVTEEDN